MQLALTLILSETILKISVLKSLRIPRLMVSFGMNRTMLILSLMLLSLEVQVTIGLADVPNV